MFIGKIPAGTRIYLGKSNNYILYIKPNSLIEKDSLYVIYDVKIDGKIAIPRGTRIVGDWVAESLPSLGAQLQISSIHMNGSVQPIFADSDIFDTIANFNSREIKNSNHLYVTNKYKFQSGKTKRFIKLSYNDKPLIDGRLNISYIEIPTREIIVTLTKDFVPYPDLSNSTPDDIANNVGVEYFENVTDHL